MRFLPTHFTHGFLPKQSPHATSHAHITHMWCHVMDIGYLWDHFLCGNVGTFELDGSKFEGMGMSWSADPDVISMWKKPRIEDEEKMHETEDGEDRELQVIRRSKIWRDVPSEMGKLAIVSVKIGSGHIWRTFHMENIVLNVNLDVLDHKQWYRTMKRKMDQLHEL